MTDKELLALKKRVEDSTRLISEKKGQRTMLFKQLKDDYKVDTVKQGDKLLEDLLAKLDKNEARIEELKLEIEKQLK